MTDLKNSIPETTNDTDNQEERKALRERAKIMGLSYSPNISNALLRDRIAAHLNNEPDPGEPATTADSADNEEDDSNVVEEVDQDQAINRLAAAANNKPGTPLKPLNRKQREQAEREKQWAQQLKLVRVRITCLNPLKKDLKGEVFSVSNQYLGTVRKFVPFGEATDAGYHLPYVLYNEIKGRQFQSITVKKEGQTSLPSVRLVNEFAIELLPDLTKEELQALARTQTIAANA